MEYKLFNDVKVILKTGIKVAARFSCGYKVFHSEMYNRVKKSCSYVIHYFEDKDITQYAKILYFIEYDSKFYALINSFNILKNDVGLHQTHDEDQGEIFEYQNAILINITFFIIN